MFRFLFFFQIFFFFSLVLSKNANHIITSSYDQNFANRTLLYAYGAYCDKTQLINWNCKWCKYLPNFKIHSVTNFDFLQAFTGYDSDYNMIVISFRGSHNFEDWILDDVEVKLIPYPAVKNGSVDKGFYNAWLKIQSSIMTNVQELIHNYPNSDILLTGHSLGAALTQLCAIEVSEYNKNVTNNANVLVYTYGSPRWCNLPVVEYYANMTDLNWRIVNHHDMVPKLPHENKGYHHTWTEVWYTSDEPLKYKICDSSGEDPNCDYWQDSADDHLLYMDIYESCESSAGKGWRKGKNDNWVI